MSVFGSYCRATCHRFIGQTLVSVALIAFAGADTAYSAERVKDEVKHTPVEYYKGTFCSEANKNCTLSMFSTPGGKKRIHINQVSCSFIVENNGYLKSASFRFGQQGKIATFLNVERNGLDDGNRYHTVSRNLDMRLNKKTSYYIKSQATALIHYVHCAVTGEKITYK